MPNIQKKPSIESAVDGTSPCLSGKPYSTLVFDRVDGNTVPLYLIGGVAGGPWGSMNALAKAHKKHGGSCFYCKKAIADADFSIDHVEPSVKGGSDTLQNLVICHKDCNIEKGRQVIEAYSPQAGKEWLTALLKQVQYRLNKLAS